MSDIKFSIINLEKAISRLEEAVNEPQVNDFVIDATIQRFEFVIELFWKTLKRLMYIEGIESSTPKETLIKARENKWLSDSDLWMQMLC